ncbi:MAG: PfkB family carbohydrate kinase [Candidatus Micrarchaeota archaeon]
MTTAHKQPRVLGIGASTFDIVARCSQSELKSYGFTRGKSSLLAGSEFEEMLMELKRGKRVVAECLGGKVRNTLEGLRRAANGNGENAYVCAVGSDKESARFVNGLEKAGINSLHSSRKKCRIGKTIVFVDEERERTLAYTNGDAEELAINEVRMHEKTLKNSEVLLASSLSARSKAPIGEAVRHLMTVAKENSVLVALTVECSKTLGAERAEVIEILRNADILFMNESEALTITQEIHLENALGKLKEVSPVVAVVGHGANYAYVQHDGYTLMIRIENENRVDNTGACDLFASGVLLGQMEKLGIERTGKIAAGLVSEVVQRFGASFVELEE